jgi:S1-C subfamily serine protease
MNTSWMTCISLATLVPTFALAEKLPQPPLPLPKFEIQGAPLRTGVTLLTPVISAELDNSIPTAELLQLAQRPVRDLATFTRSAKDAEIYRTIAPSVVEVRTKDALGSGSLVNSSGEILTNWHVVAGNSVVAIVYKPAVEGAKPGPNEMKLGRVVKYDQVSDLALVKAAEVPSGRIPIRLGDASEIVIGEDVRAIGHPHQNDWSLTKGIISQYRHGYVWAYGAADAGTGGEQTIKHKADVIQTQTPINPGNSGGPLISDSGTLIGVNSGKGEGEGLNFAVSVEDVRRFLTEPAKPNAQVPKSACEPKEMSRFRNKEDNAAVLSYDLNCGGKANAEYIVPDRKTDAIRLVWDRNGDGRPDVVFYDFKRRGKWDLSFWDADFEGRYTLVGYHDDGGLKPTRFESYADFQKRLAAQQ